uniref:Uncharacterized protein n=1 Tax=Anguilla anguilla TaxID=7936 RepID=A0A0E9VSC2_ANGAN
MTKIFFTSTYTLPKMIFFIQSSAVVYLQYVRTVYLAKEYIQGINSKVKA